MEKSLPTEDAPIGLKPFGDDTIRTIVNRVGLRIGLYVTTAKAHVCHAPP
jgi:hypothetical protein